MSHVKELPLLSAERWSLLCICVSQCLVWSTLVQSGQPRSAIAVSVQVAQLWHGSCLKFTRGSSSPFFDSDVQQVPVILLGEVSGLGRGMFRKASVS